MPLEVGTTFAGYTLVRRLGDGGMGEVYLAQHPRLPRDDALKLLGSNVSADRTFRERFLREADLACKLWHPHIVGVHDRGEYEGHLWISMDFVDGADAGSLMARRYPAGMPHDLVTAVVTAVGSALDYAHRQGLLHRDVKPANIMITNIDDEAERRILLTDFGIAKPFDDASGLTATNITVGTIDYTAPEQLMGADVDGRADQYSLAATAYHLLTGAPPFRDSNPAVVISRHLNNQPPSLAKTRPDLAALDPVLATALAKDPNNRYATCSDFARALVAPPSRNAGAPTFVAPTMPATPNAPDSASSQSPILLSPGWYSNPSGNPGTLYWDGQGWHSPPLPTAGAKPKQGGSQSAPLLLVLGIAVALVVIGSMLFLSKQNRGSSPSSASTSAITTEVTVSAESPPTFTRRVSKDDCGTSSVHYCTVTRELDRGYRRHLRRGRHLRREAAHRTAQRRPAAGPERPVRRRERERGLPDSWRPSHELGPLKQRLVPARQRRLRELGVHESLRVGDSRVLTAVR